MKIFQNIIIGILLFVLIIFGLNYFGLVQYKFFAPKFQEARREVFEHTQSYVEGKRQELTKYRLEYMRTENPTEKSAIRMTILNSFANFDESLLPPDLRSFLHEIK